MSSKDLNVPWYLCQKQTANLDSDFKKRHLVKCICIIEHLGFCIKRNISGFRYEAKENPRKWK